MSKAIRLAADNLPKSKEPVIGVFSPGDFRIDADSRKRTQNVIKMTADIIAENVKLLDGSPAKVVYSDVLIDGEKEADLVARQFEAAGVNILVGAPDTWSFPQPTMMSFIQQFPKDTPLNLTCGNSGPKPGVVYVQACSGAISQYGRLVHINVGSWPDTGLNPVMTDKTAKDLIDWCYAAITFKSLQGRRILVLGHDSMGMETALAHIIPMRNIFGLEVTRMDMKMLADMLAKKAYKQEELKELRSWLDKLVGKRIEIKTDKQNELFNQSLAMYLITRDLIDDYNAVGGGFMSQLEWGSDPRGIPLPVADVMESLFNSTFDHRGTKVPTPFATESDMQGLLTMLFFTHLSGGNPPLFMDFRKVWEPWEIKALANKLKIKLTGKTQWEKVGFVDGNNSGSASFNWAGKPGTSVKDLMARVSFPLADPGYFPGGGNSVTFLTPGGIEGIAGRMAYSASSNIFSMVWDEATSVELPEKLASAVCNTSNANWPHTFVMPKYATMGEYKQFAPANHFHMTWDLTPARLEFWMDMANVLSLTPWQNRPAYIEGVDRPAPLIHLMNGGESAFKLARAKNV
jgi:L-fucose isomerase